MNEECRRQRELDVSQVHTTTATSSHQLVEYIGHNTDIANNSGSTSVVVANKKQPYLLTSDIRDTSARFTFEAKVLAKYETYKGPDGPWPKVLRANLIDRKCIHTITLSIRCSI